MTTTPGPPPTVTKQPGPRPRHTRPNRPTHPCALARYYDPTIGRFTAVDPVIDAARPGSLDRFGYSLGSPVTLSDPTGLRPDDCDRGNSTCSNTGGTWSVTPKPPPGVGSSPNSSVGGGQAAVDAASGTGSATDSSGDPRAVSWLGWQFVQRLTGANVNEAEWKLCWGLGPLEGSSVCGSARSTQDEVYDAVQAMYGYDPREGSGPGVGNAYQHQLLAALLATRVGEPTARRVLNAHEQINGQAPANALMDEMNNELGLAAARQAGDEWQAMVQQDPSWLHSAYWTWDGGRSTEQRATAIVALNMSTGTFVAVDRSTAYVRPQ